MREASRGIGITHAHARMQRARAKIARCKKCNIHAGFYDCEEFLANSSFRLRGARSISSAARAAQRAMRRARVAYVHFSLSRFAVFFAVL
jgi:hypothetical protein